MRTWLCMAVAVCACTRQAKKATPTKPKAPVEATATVDRAVATTGDVIKYTVVVTREKGLDVQIPEPGAEIAGLRIIDMGEDKPVEQDGRVIEKRWYELRADLVGTYILPSVKLAYASPNDASKTETLQTSQIFLEVKSVLPPEGAEQSSDIRDIKPLRPIETATPWKWYAAGGCAALFLLGLGIWLWRRSRRQEPAVPPPPAHEVAYAALDLLRDTDFEDAKAVRLYYFRISEVLRAYLEGRFGVNATDLTTDEILPRMATLEALSSEQRAGMRGFLVDTDQVKFAAHRPTDDEIQQVYDRALGFVEATREVPHEPAKPEAS